MRERVLLFVNPFGDGRYEDLFRGDIRLNVLRDFAAGLVVAMVAIPLAMGFAIASGLRPEQGIIGGAVAGAIGALFGGSKYQVYGPTAAFIPIIAAIMSAHDHGFLVLCSLFAAAILGLMGLFAMGRIVKLVPHSIVVGFSIGIAVTIGLSQLGEVLGISAPLSYQLSGKIRDIAANTDQIKVWAFALAILTLVLTKLLIKISVFVPAPLIALAVGTVLSMTLLSGEGLALISTKYGAIPSQSWKFTPPTWSDLNWANAGDLIYFSLAIVFVAAIESLLCSRMADRLAGNRGTPFNPDKELFGQGAVMLFTPLLNGFPHTGALARTATNIRLGAISPLAGVFKCVLKLSIAYYLARYLELVPMACIGGILLYVALNMVKPSEVQEVLHMGRGHVLLMLYTAIAVILTDFLTGVLTAIAIYAVWKLWSVEGVSKETATGVVLNATPRLARATSHASAQHHVTRATDCVRAQGPFETFLPNASPWRTHIRQRPRIALTAYVHPQASVIGPVELGDHVHIAAGSSVRADEGAPFFVGANTNIQDGVVIHALKEKFVHVGGQMWAVYIGKKVSIAHDALVHGPCHIGDDTFVGFKAVVHDSIVGSGCFIGIGAIVVGVEIPNDKFVPHGMIVQSAEQVKALPDASAAHSHFNEDVVDVNRGLVAAYRQETSLMPRIAGRGSRGGAGWDAPRRSNQDF